jgi:hypothetical protein
MAYIVLEIYRTGKVASGATESHRVLERSSILWENEACFVQERAVNEAGFRFRLRKLDSSGGAAIAAPQLPNGKSQDEQPKKKHWPALGEKQDKG